VVMMCSNTYYLCIPSTIRQWNSLDPPIRNVDSIAKFKTELRKRKDISQVPKHYEIGPTCWKIISFCSYESVGLPQVKGVSPKT
jgi:hypothetical protein